MEKKNIPCSVCHKEMNTYCCRGCDHEFCFAHLSEHRQTLSEQLHGIVDDYNLFNQNISEQTKYASDAVLIEQIDRWERASIRTIERTAQRCRSEVAEHGKRVFTDVHEKLRRLTEQIKQFGNEHDFNECDLNRIKNALATLRREWTGPSDIFIQHGSQEFVRKIDVVPAIKWKDAKWKATASVVAGCNGKGQELNQLICPFGIAVDRNKNVFIADHESNNVVRWDWETKRGTVIVDGNKENEDDINRLTHPTDLLVNNRDGSIVVVDWGRKRLVKWVERKASSLEVLIDNIDCEGVAMDKHGFLYVTDGENHAVRQWREGAARATIIAGGHEPGNRVDQFNSPRFIFVDHEHSIYVSDNENERVVKWQRGAKEGKVIAGGNGAGNRADQLSQPQGVLVDRWGHVYVADSANHRVMRYCEGKSRGELVVGGNGQGSALSQLSYPTGLSFDDEGNLYVADRGNHRVVKFDIISS